MFGCTPGVKGSFPTERHTLGAGAGVWVLDMVPEAEAVAEAEGESDVDAVLDEEPEGEEEELPLPLTLPLVLGVLLPLGLHEEEELPLGLNEEEEEELPLPLELPLELGDSGAGEVVREPEPDEEAEMSPPPPPPAGDVVGTSAELLEEGGAPVASEAGDTAAEPDKVMVVLAVLEAAGATESEGEEVWEREAAADAEVEGKSARMVGGSIIRTRVPPVVVCLVPFPLTADGFTLEVKENR